MPTTPIQAIIDPSADSSLSAYVPSTQAIPAGISNANVYISTTQQYITNYVNVNNDVAGGDTTQVQFNTNDQLTGDSGFTYNATTDTLTVAGNLNAGGLLTNNLYYANGTPWTFGSSSYSNSNVGAYLPTYTGNVSANYFSGNGSLLTSITGANVTGYVPTATTATSATTAGTVTTAAQPNITSVGSLVGLTVSNASGVVNFATTSDVTLGGVSNLHITGGTDGQVLTTNGSGNLSWTTVSSGSSFNGGTITDALFVSNATGSTNYNNGALKVTGGVGIGENLHVLGHIASDSTVYAGHLADFGSWNNPVFVGKDAGANYVQAGMVNSSNTGSADWIAYGESSTTDTGWADLGFTSTAFNDPLYTITKASDGYVFVQGLDASHGGPQGGNLVLATGGDGANNDIVFALGSFYANAEFARMDDDSNTFYVGGHAYGATSENPTPRVVNLNVNGNIESSSNINIIANSFVWNFGEGGATFFPTLTVDIHNGGNQQAQTLQFGDNTQQAIITGPTPGLNASSQRLIIQGQRGNGTGEGGDVYLWGGDADTNGGDIKIYAGNADNVSSGSGGYVNIEGGSGFDNGGYVSMTAGQSSNGAGATASVTGGYGNTVGGEANIRGGGGSVAGGSANISGGYGAGGPGGNVTIVAGGSANGLAEYGNVNITAGATSWVFGNDGNLTIPGLINLAGGTGVIESTANNVSIYSDSGQLNGMLFYGDGTGNDGVDIYGANGVTIFANNAGSSKETRFLVDGSISVQGMIYPTTGLNPDLGNATNTFGNAFFSGDISANNIGNIASIDIDGSSSNVLYGNGVFAAAPSGGSYGDSNVVTLLSSFGSNSISTTGNIAAGAITASGKIGYSTGSSVTQTTSRGNGVNINALAGTVVTVSATMVAGQIDTFIVINSEVDPNNDIILAQVVSPLNIGTYNVVAGPSSSPNGFYINLINISGFTTINEAITIRFMIVKAPNA